MRGPQATGRGFGASGAGNPAIATALRGAVQHHQAGRLAEAEQAYRGVLAQDPRNPTALHYLGVIASQRGQFDQAIDLISQAVRLQPDAVNPNVNLANALRNAGRYDEAEKRVRRALELDPKNAEAHISLGITLRQLGRNEEAVEALRQAASIAPGNPTAHYNLGNALRAIGENERAEDAYQRALSIRPNFVFALNNLALAQTELEKFDAAENSYRLSLEHEPKFAETHYNLGNFLRDRERLDEACASFRRAVEINPKHHQAYNNLGFALQKQKNYDESDAAFRQAIALKPDFFEAQMNLADSLFERNRGAEAIATYEAVIANHADQSIARFRLADTLRTTGDTAAAERIYRELASDNPRSLRAHSAILEIHGGDPDCDSVDIVREHLDDPNLDEAGRASCGFALSDYYDSIGSYAEAFGYVTRANAARRQTFEYDITEMADLVARIREVFSAEMVAEAGEGGDPDPSPIFIVGTPRSGSTLTEQILDCHSQISGAGEAQVAIGLHNREIEKFGENYPLFVRHWGPAERLDFGRTYMEQIRVFCADTPRVVDKLLQNYIRVGLLKLALPNARFLNMRRDPLDVGLSIYRSNFTSLHRYAYTQEEIAGFIRLYDEVTRHWQDVFPGSVLDVRYEDVVAEPEAQVRRILEHCSLDYEPACLDFHQSDRVVRTRSALQVRQPLNTRGIGRWRNYAAELEPMRKAIGEDLLMRWSSWRPDETAA